MLLVDRQAWWPPQPGACELRDLTVSQLLDEAARDTPDSDAVVVSAYPELDLNVRWSYAELATRCDRFARALIAIGVDPGDAVALWAPNVPYWLVAEFAVAAAGATLVPVNPTYRHSELCHALSDSGASVCLFLPRFDRLDLWSELRVARAQLPHLRRLISLAATIDDTLDDDVLSLPDFLELGDAVSAEALAERKAAVRTGDVAQIQYTSGTTGKPKGAELAHHAIVNNAMQAVALWKVSGSDRWCNPLPLFHTAGCAMLALGAVAARAAHLPIVRFEPERVFETIARERCTMLEVVPTILTALIERQRQLGSDLSSLRLVGTSGAPTPDRLGRICEREWDVPLRVLYGSTEVAPTVSGTAPDEPDELGWSTVGRPLPWSEVRIVDPSTRSLRSLDEPGELEVRGYQVMVGYHGRPDLTADAITADGWFATGDLALIDESGYLRIVGRLKDVIIRGGENLYPAEIEDVIREHPAVTDAAVVGVPDEFFGEQACAMVRVHEQAEVDADALQQWLRQRVTHQKVPRYVLFSPTLPQTASGKVQRYLVREQAVRQLGLEAAGK